MPLFDIYISPDEPVYVISVVRKIVCMPVLTLRQLDKQCVICPKRVGKKSRLYCLKDVKKLEYIHYLMEEKRVNIHGIKIILKISVMILKRHTKKNIMIPEIKMQIPEINAIRDSITVICFLPLKYFLWAGRYASYKIA